MSNVSLVLLDAVRMEQLEQVRSDSLRADKGTDNPRGEVSFLVTVQVVAGCKHES